MQLLSRFKTKRTSKTSVTTVFRLRATAAKTVQLAGDFNGWQPQDMMPTEGCAGEWKLPLQLRPGLYQYKLMVDGHWQLDPVQPDTMLSSVGTVNSVIQVGKPA